MYKRQISDFVDNLKSAGLNASFDEGQGRFFIGAKDSGLDQKFEIKMTAFTQEQLNAQQTVNNAVKYDSLTAAQKNSVLDVLASIQNDTSSDKIDSAVASLMEVSNAQAKSEVTGYYRNQIVTELETKYFKKDENGKTIYQKNHKDKNGNPIPVYEPYHIKVFNTIDFAKSMHYNPFAYISEKNREKDILKFVEVLIKNTSGNSPQSGEDFWVKAEKLLYTAYIAMIFTLSPESERNFETLIDMINLSECREEDETFKNAVDVQFECVEAWLNGDILPAQGETNAYDFMQEYEPTAEQKRIGAFAIKQFKAYKLAAGKTAKSILISCSTRLAPFAIDEVLEITSYDELHLDKLGDELSALFVIISDTDATFNFLVAILYSQMFNLLCTRADNSKGGRLTYHVRCLLDEFANIGEIPNFDKLIATIRSREISASIILQAKSQLKAIYKDNADTIEGNCDTTLFLGGKEKTTLKEISESLGKETIDSFNTSNTRGQSESYGLNYQKLGKELKSQDELAVMDGGKCILQLRGVRPFFSDKYDITRHKNYCLLSDDNPKNEFDIEKYVSEKKRMHKSFSVSETFDLIECSGQSESTKAAERKRLCEAVTIKSAKNGSR